MRSDVSTKSSLWLLLSVHLISSTDPTSHNMTKFPPTLYVPRWRFYKEPKAVRWCPHFKVLNREGLKVQPFADEITKARQHFILRPQVMVPPKTRDLPATRDRPRLTRRTSHWWNFVCPAHEVQLDNNFPVHIVTSPASYYQSKTPKTIKMHIKPFFRRMLSSFPLFCDSPPSFPGVFSPVFGPLATLLVIAAVPQISKN